MRKSGNIAVFDDQYIKSLNQKFLGEVSDDEVLEGEVVQDRLQPVNAWQEQEELRRRIDNGEWDNLDDCPAFAKMTQEGKVLVRVEAIEKRIRQLETRLPMLVQKNQTAAYVQVLKRIKALDLTKTGILDLFYRDLGQRDLDHG